MLRGDRRPCLDPPTQHSKLHLDRFGRFRTSRQRLPMQTVPILYDLHENAINARLKKLVRFTALIRTLWCNFNFFQHALHCECQARHKDDCSPYEPCSCGLVSRDQQLGHFTVYQCHNGQSACHVTYWLCRFDDVTSSDIIGRQN